MGGALLFGLVFSGRPAPQPPLPPLLENVSAGGGWWGMCPAENADEARMRKKGMPLGLSPELGQRLIRAFPAASSEKRLVEMLGQQGFELLPPCRDDRSIKSAAFKQRGGGILSYPLTANVYWKVDEANNIVWTKGFVAYTGL